MHHLLPVPWISGKEIKCQWMRSGELQKILNVCFPRFWTQKFSGRLQASPRPPGKERTPWAQGATTASSKEARRARRSILPESWAILGLIFKEIYLLCLWCLWRHFPYSCSLRPSQSSEDGVDLLTQTSGGYLYSAPDIHFSLKNEFPPDFYLQPLSYMMQSLRGLVHKPILSINPSLNPRSIYSIA